MMNQKNIENIIGHKFKDWSLLETALTHSSYANEHNTKSYENMEFLGDSILNFVVAEKLYNVLNEEGQMSLVRSRSEERRVGKECTAGCRCRVSPYH